MKSVRLEFDLLLALPSSLGSVSVKNMLVFFHLSSGAEKFQIFLWRPPGKIRKKNIDVQESVHIRGFILVSKDLLGLQTDVQQHLYRECQDFLKKLKVGVYATLRISGWGRLLRLSISF